VRVHRLEREQVVRAPLDRVFTFFSDARNLERITPDWLSFEVEKSMSIATGVGTRIHYRLKLRGLPLRWVSRIEVWEENRAFVDVQAEGPYRSWHHRHEFERLGEGTVVRDRVRYVLPFGPAGELANLLFVRRDLRRIFDHRRAAVSNLLG
jgi:ligand-binding SRPBCC domain-containing protein